MQESFSNKYQSHEASKSENSYDNIPSTLHNKSKRYLLTQREWTEEEKNKLIELNNIHPHNWRLISRMIQTKTPIQCSYQLQKIISEMSTPKFSRNDEVTVIELVEIYGKNWTAINQLMNHKYGEKMLKKQYYEHILPNITKENYKKETDTSNTDIIPIVENNIINIDECKENLNISDSYIDTNIKITQSYKKLLEICKIIIQLDDSSVTSDIKSYIMHRSKAL